jgi:hypothetical protein
MRDAPFLRFDAVILPPPWPAVVALLVVLGVFWLALQVARREQTAPRALNVAASFVLVTALVAALIQILALAGVATQGVLGAIGAGLAAASVGLLAPSYRARARASFDSARSLFADSTVFQRSALVASAVTVAALGLASLGPPTDIDTLAYHLSVPLDWLAHGGAYPTPDWLHARLVGVGESLNLLGLALGTDCLGSLFQASGLLVAAAALTSLATTQGDRALAVALVASCPALPFLTLTGKPQLMPAAASTTALALYAWHRRTGFTHANAGTWWLLFGSASFAVACKYSFIPAGAVLAILVLAALWRTTWFTRAALAGLSLFVAIALPVYVRNVLYYGDPLSPLFERLRTDADPIVTTFSWYLRNFSGSHSFGNLVRVPWQIVVPTGPGHLTTVLGAGALAALAVPIRRYRNWDVLAAAAVVALVAAAIGQLQARFFFEPYLWSGLAAVLAAWSLRKQVLLVLICLQMLVTVPAAFYGTARLLPAALTSGHREQALTSLAADYALARWLDGVLPEDAMVATDRRSSLYMPRPALHADIVRTMRMAQVTESAKRGRILAMLAESGATTLIVTAPAESSPFGWLVADLGPPAHVSPEFRATVRNPWREGPHYRVLVYDLRGRIGSGPAGSAR